MHILLVRNFLPDGQKSMQRYADCIEKALLARGHQVTVVSPRPLLNRLSRHRGLSKYLGYIDKFLIFPFRLKRLARGFDLVHVMDHANATYLKVLRHTPSLITCHDLLAVRFARNEVGYFSLGWSGRLFQRWILSCVSRAKNVICISEATRVDLLRLTGNTRMNVRVILNPMNWDYRPGSQLSPALRERIGLRPGERFLLHVGGTQPYKNRLGVLRIFARLLEQPGFADLRLVTAGKPWIEKERAVVAAENLEGRAIQALNITNEELRALYCNAYLLLFPSLQEGFGWPLIEAQACGCPVATSNRAPMTEVAGEAAIYLDPTDPPAAARAIAEGAPRREWLREAGLRNVRRFDPGKVIEQYLVMYEQVIRDFAAR